MLEAYPVSTYHWPEEAEVCVRTHWGRLSSTLIADIINTRWPHPRIRVSKNSVIARARKLGLSDGVTTVRPKDTQPRRKAKGEI